MHSALTKVNIISPNRTSQIHATMYVIHPDRPCSNFNHYRAGQKAVCGVLAAASSVIGTFSRNPEEAGLPWQGNGCLRIEKSFGCGMYFIYAFVFLLSNSIYHHRHHHLPSVYPTWRESIQGFWFHLYLYLLFIQIYTNLNGFI